MNFINETNTLSGMKRRERQNKLMNMLQETTESTQMLNEAFVVQARCDIQDNITYLNESSKTRRNREKALREKEAFMNEKYDKTMDYFFLKLIEKSLLIEPEMLALNKDEIRQKIVGFRKVVEPKLNNSMMVQVCECVECYIDDLYKAEDKELVKKALKEELDHYAEQISVVLKEKVADVISEEKMLSECMQLKENNVIKQDVKQSLFKKIQLENIKLALSEGCSQTLTEDIMNSAFYETVVDYTILEAFNTLGLFGDIDLNGFRRNVQKNYTQF